MSLTLDESQRLPAGLRYPLEEAVPEPGEALEIAPRILWLRLPLPMKLDHVNVYALDEGDSWTIVDTGFDHDAIRDAWETALSGPLAGKPVRRVIATHHHPDHIGYAGWFQKTHGAELWTTRTAYLHARMMELDDDALTWEAGIAHAARHGASQPFLDAWRGRGPRRFFRTAQIQIGYRRLKEGDRVEAAGRVWKVLIGHGHAPEHATLWSADGEIVLAGDQILPRISPNLSVFPTEPEADPVGDWIATCERFVPFARPGHLVLPGHNRPFTGLPKRLRQLIENHHGAIKRLRKVLAEPRSAADCFDAIYKREIGLGEYGLALGEAISHLNHMMHQGEATRARGDDGVWRYRLKEEP